MKKNNTITPPEIDTDDYAKRILIAKNVELTPENIGRIRSSLNKAYGEVYKAVAFDVDGTLTTDESIEIDSEICIVIRELLIRGVHVILISGRGRQSMKDAVLQIIKKADISPTYLRRLSCIVHNGVMLLRTTTVSESDLLKSEIVISNQEVKCLTEIKDSISNLSDYKSHLGTDINITEEPSNKPYSLRINYSKKLHEGNPEFYNSFYQEVRKIVDKYSSQNGEKIFLTSSKYESNYLLNITNTNKISALEYLAKRVGISPESILKVGDQGDPNGNDFDLLDNSSGFTVGTISGSLTGCFPIMKGTTGPQLKGARATRHLINSVLLFPPLSLEPVYQEEQLKAFYNFEALAAKRARYEVKLFTEKLKIRIHRLIDARDEFFDFHLFQLSDIFDLHTGSIIIKPHEVFGIPSYQSARALFGIQDDLFHKDEVPLLKWAMFSDTNLLLRGPNYYWGLTHSQKEVKSKEGFQKYAKACVEFLDQSLTVVESLSKEKPTILAFKYYLAILDNIRNIALNLLYTAYASEDPDSKNEIQELYRWNSFITALNYNAMFDESHPWSEIFNQHKSGIRQFSSTVKKLTLRIKKVTTRPLKGFLRNWREADFFFENVISINLGLHEFINQTETKLGNKEKLMAVGLVYGGIELPFIARRIAQSYQVDIKVALINISLYSSRVNKEKVTEENPIKEVSVYGKALETLRVFSHSKVFEHDSDFMSDVKNIILLDDNCTTARTLQVTRTIFLINGFNVTGAISVKFPSTNRYAHMLFPNHGIPDPDILLSFIRGFVSPTPYTRIFRKNSDEKNLYLDESRVFDKAKNRVCRYLKKNGNKTYD